MIILIQAAILHHDIAHTVINRRADLFLATLNKHHGRIFVYCIPYPCALKNAYRHTIDKNSHSFIFSGGLRYCKKRKNL
jgi:hypothetical protein